MEKPSLIERIVDGLDRIGAVSRADSWSTGESLGLTPTQAAILTFLSRRDPARLQEVAAHLDVSLPTASGAVAALERKALVIRRRDPADGRALALAPTAEGRTMAGRLESRSSRLGAVLSTLPEAEQADFFLHLVKVIRGLQLAGAIPPQRLCVTCRHFRPFAHPGTDAPHHCALVNAPFGNRDLRTDCGEHEENAPAEQTAIWSAFARGTQASRHETPTEQEPDK